MKKTITTLAWVLVFLLLLLPVGVLLSRGLGYVFHLESYPLFAVLPAICGVIVIVLLSKIEPDIEIKTARSLFSLSAPLSVIATAFYMQANASIWTLLCCIVSIIVCICLAIAWGKAGPFKTGSVSSAAVLAVAVGALSFFCLVFGNFGAREVVRHVDSPSGSYVAEIVIDDQGALGGATLVEVFGTNRIDAWLIHIYPKAKQVYSGPWGEYDTMELRWKNDSCLEINGSECIIP